MVYDIRDHLEDGITHVFTVQNAAALFVNDLTLLVIDLIVLKQVTADTVVVALDLLLCLFDGAGQHLMLDLLILGYTKALEYIHQTLGTEQTHQIILQGNVEAGFTRISLTTGTTAQLVIDTAGLVTLCTDDL